MLSEYSEQKETSMIYKYYCVDCGNEFDGQEIAFDLAQLIEPDDTSPEKSLSLGRVTQITAEELISYIQQQGVVLEHGKRVKVRVRMVDVLRLMGQNIGELDDRGDIESKRMGEYTIDQLEEAMENVFTTNENLEVDSRKKSDYISRFKNCFELNKKAEQFLMFDLYQRTDLTEEQKQKAEATIQNKTENFEASFYIEPEFFESGKSRYLYTIRHSLSETTPHMQPMKAPLEVRGYCPKCGKPVIKEAGKYPHVLVGLLGVQSAGKTSMIMAMLEQIKESFTELGLSYPGQALCDSRYDIMKDNEILYRHGWAVVKTNASSNAGTFNASMEVSSSDRKVTKLITFIDIAGEQCYDVRTEQLNIDALRTYPLIGNCSLYLLCSCIDQTGYGNADGKNVSIRPDAIINIAIGIYQHFDQSRKIPPMCLVMTKTDIAAKPGSTSDDRNPFDQIIPAGPKNYQFSSQLENLKMTYASVENRNIREPLEWCARTYEEMKSTTYLTMMACSALGRAGVRFEGEDIDKIDYYRDSSGREMPFVRTRIDDLWKWILKTIGVVGIDESKGSARRLSSTPSFREFYTLPGEPKAEDSFAASEAEIRSRLDAVSKLFLNASEEDWELLKELKKEDRIFQPKRQERLENVVKRNRKR